MSDARDKIADVLSEVSRSAVEMILHGDEHTDNVIAIVRDALLATPTLGDSSNYAVIEDALDAAFGKETDQ